jgi:Uri superfamily endonuclease
MKGSYILLLELHEPQQVSVGKLGVLDLAEGPYAYVGSALNGLEARINRHFRMNKKHQWHIDYLLEQAVIYEAILIPEKRRLECTLAQALQEGLSCIRRFGSSDCQCPGHLFYASERNEVNAQVDNALANLGVILYRQSVAVSKSSRHSIPPKI